MREMRRKNQQMSKEKTEAVLARNTNGVLNVSGEDGYPYGVPVSFVYQDGNLYFHSAPEGHKIDAIRKNPNVSFTVVDEDTVVSAEYTTYFRSVIVFGQAEIVTETDERQRAFTGLIEKYSRDESDESKADVIGRSGDKARIIRIRPTHVTGKEAIEYVRKAGEEK
ncbi:MAG: pyridoxamine 5'-phosphate oxidase family protein [Lachnospiraceae bacterium]|nr:pyridoxamine 5'-phosphate oxidase family protein [Lachnospiraceae bacterium]